MLKILFTTSHRNRGGAYTLHMLHDYSSATIKQLSAFLDKVLLLREWPLYDTPKFLIFRELKGV